jgi:hypothetical protein
LPFQRCYHQGESTAENKGSNVFWMHLKMTLAVLVLVGTLGGMAAALGGLAAFAKWALLIAGVFFLFLIVPFSRDYLGRAGVPASARLKWWSAYALLLLCVTLGVVFTTLGMSLAVAAGIFVHVYEETVQGSATTRSLMVIVTALFTAVVGGVFFFFRLRQRLIYGATEAVAGVTIAAHRMSVEPTLGLPTETSFYFAVLTAGIYLVVRGLDNMHQAVKAGDPLVERLRAFAPAIGAKGPRASTWTRRSH